MVYGGKYDFILTKTLEVLAKAFFIQRVPVKMETEESWCLKRIVELFWNTLLCKTKAWLCEHQKSSFFNFRKISFTFESNFDPQKREFFYRLKPKSIFKDPMKHQANCSTKRFLGQENCTISSFLVSRHWKRVNFPKKYDIFFSIEELKLDYLIIKSIRQSFARFSSKLLKIWISLECFEQVRPSRKVCFKIQFKIIKQYANCFVNAFFERKVQGKFHYHLLPLNIEIKMFPKEALDFLKLKNVDCLT